VKEWVKNPLVLSSGCKCAHDKQQTDLDGRHPRAQINGVQAIPDPLRLSTFKRRGGVQNPGCISPTATIIAPGSTAREAILDPPHLSTFKRRGGGSGIRGASFRWLRLKRPDQRRAGDPDLSLLSAFNQRGPFPVRSVCGLCSL
jgi:hypothetical protein